MTIHESFGIDRVKFSPPVITDPVPAWRAAVYFRDGVRVDIAIKALFMPYHRDAAERLAVTQAYLIRKQQERR
jgi:hypothetical protein